MKMIRCPIAANSTVNRWCWTIAGKGKLACMAIVGRFRGTPNGGGNGVHRSFCLRFVSARAFFSNLLLNHSRIFVAFPPYLCNCSLARRAWFSRASWRSQNSMQPQQYITLHFKSNAARHTFFSSVHRCANCSFVVVVYLCSHLVSLSRFSLRGSSCWVLLLTFCCLELCFVGFLLFLSHWHDMTFCQKCERAQNGAHSRSLFLEFATHSFVVLKINHTS